MTRLLNRMVQDKLLRVHRLSQNDPYYFFLPTTKAPTLHSHIHERDCAEVYVAYETSGQLLKWAIPEAFSDYDEYESIGLRPDRISTIGNKIVFWEIDRGTENYDKVNDKIPRYIELGKRHPTHRFHVVFTTKDSFRQKNRKQILRQSAEARAKRILLDLIEYKRGSQFVVGCLKDILSDPLGAVFVSPLEPETLKSLVDLV